MRFLFPCLWAALVLLMPFRGALAQWEQVLPPSSGDVHDVLPVGDALMAAATNGLYRSEDGGATWSLFRPNFDRFPFLSLYAHGDSVLLAGLYDGGLVRSADGGATWTQRFGDDFLGLGIFQMTGRGDTVFARSAERERHYRSVDRGETWEPMQPEGNPDFMSTDIFLDGSRLHAAADSGLYYTDDAGRTWTRPANEGMGELTQGIFWLSQVEKSGGRLVVASMFAPGLFLSDDGGESWRRGGGGLPPEWTVTALESAGDMLVAALFNGSSQAGLYHSADGGETWMPVAAPHMDRNPAYKLFYEDGHLYTSFGGMLVSGWDGGGLWRLPFAHLAAGEAEPPEPSGAVLLSSAPNPFHGQATIRFHLDQAGPVRLTVFNGTGREVTRLVDGFRPAGEHRIRFSAEGLPAGPYVCVVETGTRRAAHVMIRVQ